LFTGAGLPQQYTDANGSLTGAYQFTTQATDENPSTVTQAAINGLITNATGPNAYYGFFTILCHLDNQAISNQCATDTLSVAQANAIPMVSAKQAGLFWDGRGNTSFTNVSYAASTVSSTINTPVANIQTMTPLRYGTKTLTGITLNGATTGYITQTINGIQYGFTTVPSGTTNLVATYQ
jgi:hypothetical protein